MDGRESIGSLVAGTTCGTSRSTLDDPSTHESNPNPHFMHFHSQSQIPVSISP